MKHEPLQNKWDESSIVLTQKSSRTSQYGTNNVKTNNMNNMNPLRQDKNRGEQFLLYMWHP